MKKLFIFLFACAAFLGFQACETQDDVVFVAQDADGVAFTNTFSSEYVLTGATAGNLAERFTWNSADFGEPTNVTYELQRAMTSDFAEPVVVGATSENNIPVTVGDMLGWAAELGLDADPSTDAPNAGSIFVRLRAFIGAGGNEGFSEAASLSLVLPEETGDVVPNCELDELFLVGAGVTFAGWSWDNPGSIACSGDGVYTGNIDFLAEGDANFRFFTVATDWGSGRNFPYYVDNGYTIDPNFEDAQDGDNNFRFVGTTGKYFLTIDDINKTITLDAPTPTGECEFDQMWAVGAGLPDAGWSWDTPIQFMCSGDGRYEGWVNLTSDGDANFRFFTVATDWGSGRNFPYYVDNGYTIDPNFEDAQDGDNNFKFIGTTGAYYLVIDDINKVISLQ